MIGASIEQLHRQLPDLRAVLGVYDRWRTAVEAGKPSALANLATTDHVSNAFLVTFIRTPYGLTHAARVMRDMQRPLPSSAGVEQCSPTVQTWSIFLHGFMRHGETKLAEQILNYMRSKGIEPNDVTWRTLINGYAQARDFDRAMETIRRARADRADLDAWTHFGVNIRWRRPRLMKALEKGRLASSSHQAPEEKPDTASEEDSALDESTTQQDPALQHYMQRFDAPDQKANFTPLYDRSFADSPAELAEQQHVMPEEERPHQDQDQDPALQHYLRRFNK